MKKRIVILGGGISGLSLAWYLKKKGGTVTLLEKSDRVGGWIQSVDDKGFFFERGPRTIRSSARELLSLIEDVGLEAEVIEAEPASKIRYILWENKLHPFPTSLISFLRSPLMKGVKRSLIKGLLKKGRKKEDLSIDAFARTRFSNRVAERFVAPFTLGIFGGKSENLSLKSCFPFLYKAHTGSRRFFKYMPRNKGTLISLKKGLESLPETLYSKMKEDIHLNCPVESMEKKGESFVINGKYEADEVYSTLPAHSLNKIFPQKKMDKIAHNSLRVVNFGWNDNVLSRPGFGYLVPPVLQEKILGVVFDSCIFPEQNRGDQTRLTVMLEPKYSVDDALLAVQKHLGILKEPDYVKDTLCEGAIAQYGVGFNQLLESVEGRFLEWSDRFHLHGSSFYGVSLNDCIKKSRI